MYDENFYDEENTTPENENEMVAITDEVSEPEKDAEPVIYCGPDKPKLGLQKYAVFVNGLPPAYKDAIMKMPEVEKLIVPCAMVEEMRAKIKRKGTAEHEYYARIDAAK